jgi:hypothetical protein
MEAHVGHLAFPYQQIPEKIYSREVLLGQEDACVEVPFVI